MSKRFGRRQKARLKTEIESLQNLQVFTEARANKYEDKIDNAPNLYKMASEICRIALNINKDFNILDSRTIERVREIRIMEDLLGSVSGDISDTATIMDICHYKVLELNVTQVFESINKIFDEKSELFKYMKVFVFDYGKHRQCIQMSDDQLRYASLDSIVKKLVVGMKNEMTRYKGEKG